MSCGGGGFGGVSWGSAWGTAVPDPEVWSWKFEGKLVVSERTWGSIEMK